MTKITIALEKSKTDVQIVFQAGVWAIHRSHLKGVEEPHQFWTVTHVPTGRYAAKEIPRGTALILAQRLFNLAPRFLEGLKLRALPPQDQIPDEVKRII